MLLCGSETDSIQRVLSAEIDQIKLIKQSFDMCQLYKPDVQVITELSTVTLRYTHRCRCVLQICLRK